ncbi:toxin-antitoxin system HicB family antitoxin [Actinoplanes sp. NPDC051494]|uniref:toxin-antitoxin system HicB family antitoxin n=1 Tax=Actinoplanes sp. NPDC051494 TaxID=3363907 RepID=UPI00379F293B
MDLTTYVARLREELANAAELGGPDARALADRLTSPLESAFRLTMLDALGSAADEITRDLAPGRVDVQWRSGDPTFVVDMTAYAHAHGNDATVMPDDTTVAPSMPEPDEGAVSRINFRLSEQLKTRIEEAAAREGLSVNAWLVRAASAAVQQSGRPSSSTTDRPPTGRAPLTGQRYTGWAR